MLKAKLKSRDSKRKEIAMREVVKDDNDTGLFVRITSKEMRKLRREVFEREITLNQWVKEKIGEI